jgi:hypothetical protein
VQLDSQSQLVDNQGRLAAAGEVLWCFALYLASHLQGVVFPELDGTD